MGQIQFKLCEPCKESFGKWLNRLHHQPETQADANRVFKEWAVKQLCEPCGLTIMNKIMSAKQTNQAEPPARSILDQHGRPL